MRILAAVFAIAAAALAAAQPVSFAHRSLQIRVGVLTQPWRGGVLPERAPRPHVWGQLDQDPGIKPATWNLVGAQGAVMDADMFNRWSPNSGFGSYTPELGDPVTKRDAGYWEVPLSTASQEALNSFDVLLLTSVDPQLTPDQQARLRSFMDQGGVLWVDVASLPGAPANMVGAYGPPISFRLLAGTPDPSAFLQHPLLSAPYALGIDDLQAMSVPGQSLALFRGLSATGSRLQWAEAQTFESLYGPNDRSRIGVAQIGSGWQIISTLGISTILNRAVGSFDNFGFRSGAPLRDLAYVSAAKFAVNVLAFAASSSLPGQGNSRRSGSLGADIPAPLLKAWSVSAPGTNRPAAVAQGRLAFTSNGLLTLFDNQPFRDLNGDGSPDDGVSNGGPSQLALRGDFLWQHGTGPVSDPTYVHTAGSDVFAFGLQSTHQLWTADANGGMFLHDAVRLDNAPLSRSFTIPGFTNPDLIAPAAGQGFVVASGRVGTGGALALIDPRTGGLVSSASSQPFILQGSDQLGIPSAPPAIGLVPIGDGTAGSDIVAYVPFGPQAGRSAGFSSVWIGARSEAPFRVRRSGSTLVVDTRATLAGVPICMTGGAGQPLRVQDISIRAINPATGAQLTTPEFNAVFSGGPTATGTNGQFSLAISSAGAFDLDGTTTPGDATDDIAYRVDYLIDWSAAFLGTVSGNNMVRGRIELPDDATPGRAILGSPVLTSRGHVLVATSEAGALGGSYFNFRETGRGDFDLVDRFDLYDAHSFSLNGGAGLADTVSYRATLNDNDQVVAEVAAAGFNPGRRLAGLRFTAPPTVSGEQVFLAAESQRAGAPIPGAVVASLAAHPDPIAFEVEGFVESEQSVPSLAQPDYAKSDNKTNLDQFSVLGRSRFKAEPILNTNRTRIILTSLMAGTRGAVRDSISTSQPIILRTTNGTDQLIEPERSTAVGPYRPGFANGRYSTLNWYAVLLGSTPATPVVSAGRTMYLGVQSVLPGILNGTIRQDGLIYGVDRDISLNDPNIVNDTVDGTLAAQDQRPWLSQLSQIRKTAPGAPFENIAPTTALRWPQVAGVDGLESFRVRLLQASLVGETIRGITAGDSSLAVATDQGVSSFRAQEFLILDEGRAIRVDSAGNAAWSLSRTLESGGQASASLPSRTNAFSEPASIAAEGSGLAWVADRRANRAVLIDVYGVEQRTITGFRLHPTRRVPGLKSSDVQTLSGPSDVAAFTGYQSAASVALAFPGEVSDSAGTELWRNVLIADTGNNRALWLVDRYRVDGSGRVIAPVQVQDPISGQTLPALGLLYWHSPENMSGPGFAYTQVERIARPGPAAAPGSNVVQVFGFSGRSPRNVDLGLDRPAAAEGSTDLARNSEAGGGLLIVNELGGSLAETIVTALRGIPRTGYAAGAFLEFNGATFDFTSPADTTSGLKPFNGLSSVTGRYNGSDLELMVADRDGIFEIRLAQGAANGAGVGGFQLGSAAVVWQMPRQAYLGLRRNGSAPFSEADLQANPTAFEPSYARRLENGDVIIVNRHLGRLRSGDPFFGDVMIVEGRPAVVTPDGPIGYNPAAPNLGFGPLSIKFLLPPIQGARGLLRPTFADTF